MRQRAGTASAFALVATTALLAACSATTARPPAPPAGEPMLEVSRF